VSKSRTRLGIRYLLFLGVLSFSGALAAQTRSSTLLPNLDPRGAPDLTICSQNLQNFGVYRVAKSRSPTLTHESLSEKETALIKRFAEVGCDVIAVQELLGSTDQEALAGLNRLAAKLRASSNRIFDTKVGESNDPVLHNGFLVAKDRADILNTVSYSKVELPKTSPEQRPRTFSRGPLELQLSVRPRPDSDSSAKIVTIVNFHFKSKRGIPGDPAELEFETYRMEMAEAVRRVSESRHARSFAAGDTILVLLGDRNSNFDTASAQILNGTLILESFQGSAPCRLSKRGVPLCKAETARPQRLFSVLTEDPQTAKRFGTYQYKGEYSWLDEILMPSESLRYTWQTSESEGDFDSGVVYEPKDASDHALVYVRLNW